MCRVVTSCFSPGGSANRNPDYPPVPASLGSPGFSEFPGLVAVPAPQARASHHSECHQAISPQKLLLFAKSSPYSTMALSRASRASE